MKFPFLFFIIYSFIINLFYTGGDSFVYSSLYDSLIGLDFVGGLVLYYQTLLAPDFGWFLLAFFSNSIGLTYYFFTVLVSLFVFSTIFNYIINIEPNSNVYKRIILFNLFLSIQFLPLFFSSLRFGVSFAILLLAYNSTGVRRYLLYASSVLMHFSSIILISLESLSNIRFIYLLKTLFLILFLSFIPIYFFSDLIYIKFLHYLNIRNNIISVNFIKFIPLFLISLFLHGFSKNLLPTTIFSFILLVVDDERIFQIGYLYIFLRVCHTSNKYKNHFLFIISIPFIFRGFQYLYGIFTIGNGLDPQNFTF